MQILVINYPSGCIQFGIRGFFPVPQSQFRGILKKIVSRDYDRAEKVADLKRELESYVADNEALAKAAANTYVDNRTKAAELKAEAAKPFHYDGSRVTDDEFEDMKKRIREYKSKSREAKDYGESLLRKNEKLKNHIKIIDELRW